LVGRFATALASRYSGSFPDPVHPVIYLPLRYHQAWAEANFDVRLSPQWTHVNSQLVPASPSMCRNILNAFYAGIHAAHADNVVIAT
jgi:hypothetical protein